MMEAGRELDAEIAKKIMGWTVEQIVNPVGSNFEEWRDLLGWRYDSEPPPYSTDIAAAWQVVDAIKAKHGCGFFIAWQDQEHGVDAHWEAGFIESGENGYGHEWVATGTADTAPLAICRAALAFIGSTT